MRVAELTVFTVRIPLRRAIRHASHARDSTENLVVRCVLDDGTTGYGEGVPRDYVTGETAESAVDLLRRSGLTDQLEPCHDFARAVAMTERLTLVEVPGDDRRCQGNAARCAVELALLDAYGRRFGEPLSAVTRLSEPELYQPRDSVRYSGIITSSGHGVKIRTSALRLWVWGFRQIKVKVGMENHDDVKRLRDVRARFGWRGDVRVDVNEAWRAGQVVEKLKSFEPFRISSVEQPVSHAEVGALADIRRAGVQPIMLDESLCGMVDARRAADEGTCDLFNLRLSKCGGYIASLRLARFARDRGIGCQLGCQVGETALLSAAGRHFAASVAGLNYLEGSYDSYLVKEALATRSITFGYGGRANALPGPGLGISVDPRALDRVTLTKVPLG